MNDINQTIFSPREVIGFFDQEFSTTTKARLRAFGKDNPLLKPEKTKRGALEHYYWTTKQMPLIAAYFGFLYLPKKFQQKIITIYNQKGGVGKTTFTFNFVRILAAHGAKILVIGLDKQSSITQLLQKRKLPETVEEIMTAMDSPPDHGLYELLEKKAKLSDVIQKSEYENLHFIPENMNLMNFQVKLNSHAQRTFFFKNILLPQLNEYDFVVFDCKGEWSDLTTSAIIASQTMISPISCEIMCYNTLGHNYVQFISELKDELKHNFEEIYVANMLDNDSSSRFIYDRYRSSFEERLINTPIKKSVTVQKALNEYKSVLEFDFNAEVSCQYREVLKEICTKLFKA